MLWCFDWLTEFHSVERTAGLVLAKISLHRSPNYQLISLNELRTYLKKNWNRDSFSFLTTTTDLIFLLMNSFVGFYVVLVIGERESLCNIITPFMLYAPLVVLTCRVWSDV